jgi:hypothetical protein
VLGNVFGTYCQTVTHYTDQDSRGENLPEHERAEKSVKQTGVPETTDVPVYPLHRVLRIMIQNYVEMQAHSHV